MLNGSKETRLESPLLFKPEMSEAPSYCGNSMISHAKLQDEKKGCSSKIPVSRDKRRTGSQAGFSMEETCDSLSYLDDNS